MTGECRDKRKNLFFKFGYTEALPYLHATKIPKGERRGKCRALIFHRSLAHSALPGSKPETHYQERRLGYKIQRFVYKAGQ